MIVNDTRDYHAAKPPNMDSEVSASMLLTVNSDVTRSGLSYGRILCDRLYQRFLDSRSFARGSKVNVMEVGPGLGWASCDFLVDLRDRYGQRFDYAPIELSPELMSYSKRVFEAFDIPARYIFSDAHYIRDSTTRNSADIFIANEVVGDMITLDEIPAEWLTGPIPNHLEGANLVYLQQLRNLMERHKVPIHQQRCHAYNLGAMQLIADLYPMMRHNSIAFISEHSCEQTVIGYDIIGRPLFFSPRNVPTPLGLGTTHDFHVEYSVRFSDLETVARSCGFDVERGKLVELLDLKDDAEWLPYNRIEHLISSWNLSLDDFIQITDNHTDLFPDFAKQDPRFKLLYLHCHPRALQTLLSLSDQQYEFFIAQSVFRLSESYGQFEYLFLTKK